MRELALTLALLPLLPSDIAGEAATHARSALPMLKGAQTKSGLLQIRILPPQP